MTKHIEYPSQGKTYCVWAYGVYTYDEYPSSSVLAGQPRRTYIHEYKTLEEAQAEHPDAILMQTSHIPFAPIPDLEPEWFDPMDAGEQWSED